VCCTYYLCRVMHQSVRQWAAQQCDPVVCHDNSVLRPVLVLISLHRLQCRQCTCRVAGHDRSCLNKAHL
jgi:hypothetical protein